MDDPGVENRLHNCVLRHVAVISIRYNRRFHSARRERLARCRPYLTRLRIFTCSGDPKGVDHISRSAELIPAKETKYLCRILQAFTHEKFWIHAAIQPRRRKYFWQMVQWAGPSFQAAHQPANTRRWSCATLIRTDSWAKVC